MNHWTGLSVEFANQRNYLDELFKIYPVVPEGIRDIDKKKWKLIKNAFEKKDKTGLLNLLLSMELFPIKDSYVAYIKRDPSAIVRNPATIDRLYGRMAEMGLDEIWERCSEPKETNRQIGPLFRRWLQKGTLGAPLLPLDEFEKTKDNAILDAGDNEMMKFAKRSLGYRRGKGLDFVGRFGGKYVIGEAKFLTDFGGHQNAQFADAMATLDTKTTRAIKIGILDGVLYIPGKNKMYREITTKRAKHNIMSALVLREFLYQI
ncbi:MAG: restriction endonuclease [Candidatus Micrarchaeota archaeon]